MVAANAATVALPLLVATDGAVLDQPATDACPVQAGRLLEVEVRTAPSAIEARHLIAAQAVVADARDEPAGVGLRVAMTALVPRPDPPVVPTKTVSPSACPAGLTPTCDFRDELIGNLIRWGRATKGATGGILRPMSRPPPKIAKSIGRTLIMSCALRLSA